MTSEEELEAAAHIMTQTAVALAAAQAAAQPGLRLPSLSSQPVSEMASGSVTFHGTQNVTINNAPSVVVRYATATATKS